MEAKHLFQVVYFLHLQLALLQFNVTLPLCNSNNTVQTFLVGSYVILEKKMMMSKYTKTNCHLNVDRVTSIIFWKAQAALQSQGDLGEPD